MRLIDSSKIGWLLVGIIFVSLSGILPSRAETAKTIEIENEYLRYVIAANGKNLHFIDKQTGIDYCADSHPSKFARLTKDGQRYNASSVSYADGCMTVQFGRSGVSAVIAVTVKKHYFIFGVASISDQDIEELVFIDLKIKHKGTPEETFAGCALALNLQTKVNELPGPNSRLRAMCYPRFGFAGAKAAIIGCPKPLLRNILKEVVGAAEELPHSSIGGPWALEAPITRGSYLFNFGGLTEETVDDWISLAKNLGFKQIDFHGGTSFRFGDCRPNPKMYPDGFKSLKAVIDKLHEAGLQAGLHTYAFFMTKNCPWVTPVPDPRLGKDATFTSAESLGPNDTNVPVIETTKDMSAVTGFFVRNSATLQIDDELITYSGIDKEPPYAFTDCKRGAYGTKITPHAKGAKVHHLRECFGLFAPDGDSTLFTEVAQRTADAFNECGFDMIYLDAIDAQDVIAGPENGWHYGAKFVWELFKRLKKPALMEMSTFNHYFWFVRSRMGAWDHPNRSHKKFIDIHCEANQGCDKIFLPKHLGWWRVKTWGGPQTEPTFPDDIEYLCCKAIGTDASLSLMGIEPDSFAKKPYMQRLAQIYKNYETLRLENYFSETTKEKLKAPGEEFTLNCSEDGTWQLYPIQYAKHKVEAIDGASNIWVMRNKFGQQPVKLRIEVLMSAASYDAPENVVLADFSDPCEFTEHAAAKGLTAELRPTSNYLKVGAINGCYTASNSRPKSTVGTAKEAQYSLFEHGMRTSLPQSATWVKLGKTFSPPLDLSKHQGLGVWIYGDGQGEVLNFQLRCPKHLVSGIGEHYVVIDFTGWRYFELIEPEGERFEDYSWPYGHVYAIYRENIKYGSVETLSLWYNNIPAGQTVTCYLSPIKAVPLVKAKLIYPAVTIGKKTIIFPVEIESGCYLQFNSTSDCKLYNPQGELICEVQPQMDVPILQAGENQVRFNCSISSGLRARANVTLISQAKTAVGK